MSKGKSAEDPVKLYERIIGSAPDAEQADRLRKLSAALGISDNDALWSVLVALEFHQRLYSDLPREIAGQRAAVQADAKRIAHDALMKARTEIEVWSHQAHAQVMQAVANASTVTRAQRISWTASALLVAAAVVTLIGGGGFLLGARSGRAESLLEARELAGWAGTAEGRAAKAMGDSGELGALLRCDRPGWHTEASKGGALCIPAKDKKEGQFGWLLPIMSAGAGRQR